MPSEIALNKVAAELPRLPKYFCISSKSWPVPPTVALKSSKTSVNRILAKNPNLAVSKRKTLPFGRLANSATKFCSINLFESECFQEFFGWNSKGTPKAPIFTSLTWRQSFTTLPQLDDRYQTIRKTYRQCLSKERERKKERKKESKQERKKERTKERKKERTTNQYILNQG